MRDTDGRTYAATSVGLPTPAAVGGPGGGRDGGVVRGARTGGGGLVGGTETLEPSATRPRDRATWPASAVAVWLADARPAS